MRCCRWSVLGCVLLSAAAYAENRGGTVKAGAPTAADVGPQVQTLVRADWIEQDRRFSPAKAQRSSPKKNARGVTTAQDAAGGCDGVKNGRFGFHVASGEKDPWWQVDLEQPTTVGRVVVFGYYGDVRYYGFTVELSLDGQSWEVVADRRDNKEPSTSQGYTCRFTPCTARFIRIRQPHNSANTGRHLVEVAAFKE